MKLIAQHHGDPSAGINGETATLEVALECADAEYQQIRIDIAKTGFRIMLSMIWDFPAVIMTEEELNKMNELADKVEAQDEVRTPNPVLSYNVIIKRNGEDISCGVVAITTGRGWKFHPAYQSLPSRKFWPSAEEAIKSRGIKNFKLEPRIKPGTINQN